MNSGVKTSGITWAYLGCLSACVMLMAVLAARPSAWEAFVAASFAAGVFGFLIWRRGDVTMPIVLIFAALFRVAFLWLPPVLSDDAYRYVWDGMLQTEGINPYLYTPDAAELEAYRDNPLYENLNSESYYSVYPPVAQYVFRVGAWFYDGDWRTSFYVIKIIFAAMEFGAVLVLSRIVGAGRLLLYAWHPLVLVAGAGQAHGEAALVLFLSLTLAAAKKGRASRASIWLACAGWVKLYPFVLFPLLWRRFGWRSVVVGSVAAVLIAAPYAHQAVPANVWSSLDLYVRLFEFNAGPYYGVKELFRLLTGQDWSKQIGPAMRLFFIGGLPVLYYVDWRRGWSLRRSFAVCIGAFFLLSTTIHPWYLLGILVLVVPLRRPSWHWYWLGLMSLGTYLLYVGGPYWTWVVFGWMGWLILAFTRYRRSALDLVMRQRARGKARLLLPLLQDVTFILDLGAAEGYVSEELVKRQGIRADLIDIVDLNRTALPFRRYEGRELPYRVDAFDAVIAVFVMHHVEHPQELLREACRVSSGSVVLLESTYVHGWQHTMLRIIDRFANRIRSHGRISDDHLHFRTINAWQKMFEELRIPAVTRDLGGLFHHRVLFVLDASDAGTPRLDPEAPRPDSEAPRPGSEAPRSDSGIPL